MIYTRDGQLLSSRRWELIREALDDYRLAMLAFGSEGLLDARRSPELGELAKEAISQPGQPVVAERLRERLLDRALKN